MSQERLLDHLFRHQYGKMVSILTRLFGLEHIGLIEDVVQDTFIKAMLSWRKKMPENPEAWLMLAAKNRAIDLFRKVKSDTAREGKFVSGPSTIAINEVFAASEIEDSQLRMIFAACHPILKPKDQISFALKTISGFSSSEIASALLSKEETVKKSLSRARKSIIEKGVKFEIPEGKDLKERLNRVHEVIYLIFNEGFHSIKTSTVVRKELCAEALRLCKIIIDHSAVGNGSTHALFGLMCFHSARLESKISARGEIISLKEQDRSKWHSPLVVLGNHHMEKALGEPFIGSYHYEAAIASEHLQARSFETTNWERILMWYKKLELIQASAFAKLNIAIVHLQLNNLEQVKKTLTAIDSSKLGQRQYLYYCTKAEYALKREKIEEANKLFLEAIQLVSNPKEKAYIEKQLAQINSM